MPTYIIWFVIFVIIPLVFLWSVYFQTLLKYKKVFYLCIIGSIIFSFPWDYIASHEKIWYFTKPYILGIVFFGIPLEEWLFYTFVTILFASITVLLWGKYGVKE